MHSHFINRRAFFLSSLGIALSTRPTLATHHRHNAKRSRHTPTLKADAIMTMLAEHHIHGVRDETSDIASLLARIDAGETIQTRCGYIAQVGALAMQRAGLEARLVSAVTAGPLTGIFDGHSMFEFRPPEGWTLVDITNNRAAPHGIGIVAQCDGPRHWRTLAHDEPCVAQCELILDYANDDRIFQLPVIADQFHDDAFRDRLESFGYTYVSAEAWRQIVGEVHRNAHHR